MGAQATNVTLEEYMFFLQNPTHRELSNRHLNQIINMHGFKKLHRRPKKDILDALISINLLLPFRSTLMDNISSSASLTQEEVANDLATLAWQECALQSIETLTSIKQKNIEIEDYDLQYQAFGLKLLWAKPDYGDEEISGAKRMRNSVGTVLGDSHEAVIAQQPPYWLYL